MLTAGGCLPPDSRFWCVEAVRANGTRASNNTDVPIQKYGDWITGCVGLCEADDEIMDLGLSGMIGVDSPLLPQWNALQAEVRTGARPKCESRVTELPLPGESSCRGTQQWTMTLNRTNFSAEVEHTGSLDGSGDGSERARELGSRSATHVAAAGRARAGYRRDTAAAARDRAGDARRGASGRFSPSPSCAARTAGCRRA